MSCLIGLLFALLGWLISSATTQPACPETSLCRCVPSAGGFLTLNCLSSIEPSASSFDVTIVANESVRIECNDSPLWSGFALNASSLALEGAQHLSFKNCSPPEADDAAVILHQLGEPAVEFLAFEDLRKELTSRALRAFPQIRSLVLINSTMENADSHLFEGLTNLTELHIRKAHIQVPKNFFTNASFLNTFELSKNRPTKLPLGTFDSLGHIEFLHLRDNEIEQLEAPLFRKLSNLLLLNLHGNRLESLPADVFQGLKNLQILDLGGNNFTSLPQTLLRHTPNVVTFNLKFNNGNLTTLPPRFFENLENLISITLMFSGLHELPDDLMYGVRSLKHFQLDVNYLTELPANLLKDAVNLRSLSLVSNGLDDIPHGFFSNTRQLKKLDLGRNKMRSVEAFTFIGLESLEELNMENNGLTFIHVDAFKPISNLRIAKFSNNRLTLQTGLFDRFGHVSPFHPCRDLEELHLSSNDVTQIFIDWVRKKSQLRVLDLSYNKILRIESEDLQFSSNFLYVDLSYNSIAHIDLARLEHFWMHQKFHMHSARRNVTVSLGANPLLCDCNVYDLLRYAQNQMPRFMKRSVSLRLDQLTCAGPEYYAEQKLTELRLDELWCVVENSVPRVAGDPCDVESPCDCWFRPADNSLFVDCSAKGLTEAPAWIDAENFDYVEMNLSDNRLTLAPDMKGDGYEKVSWLNLKGNQLNTVDGDLITPKMQYLNLGNNNLTYLESDFIRKLKHVSVTVKLILEGNPWICDCKSRQLTTFLRRFPDLSDQISPKCSNVNSTLLRFEDKNCPTLEFVWVFFVGPIISVFIWIIMILFCQCRQDCAADKSKTGSYENNLRYYGGIVPDSRGYNANDSSVDYYQQIDAERAMPQSDAKKDFGFPPLEVILNVRYVDEADQPKATVTFEEPATCEMDPKFELATDDDGNININFTFYGAV